MGSRVEEFQISLVDEQRQGGRRQARGQGVVDAAGAK